MSKSEIRHRSLAAALAIALVAASAVLGTTSATAVPAAPAVACNVAPTVTAVYPAAGAAGGGTAITVTGTTFRPDATVTIGGVAATGVTVLNATTLTATAPAHAVGVVDVVVTTGAGTATLTSAFTYVAAPTLMAISPPGGPSTGGTTITLLGTGFAELTGLTIGGVSATNITIVNSTTVAATVPASTAGAKDVVVTTVGGSATFTGAFTYVDGPALTGLSPVNGPVSGGTAVTLTGTRFMPGSTSVTIGGIAIPAGSVTVNSSTSLTFTTPPHAPGAVSVAVTTPDGSITLPTAFTYLGIPTLVSGSPATSPLEGGTVVSLTGTNFAMSGTSVMIDGTTVVPTVYSPTSLSFVTPAHAAGFVVVYVSTPGGTTNPGGFTYEPTVMPAAFTIIRAFAPAEPLAALLAAPASLSDDMTLSGATPATGPTTGGTQITLSGTGFAPGVSVSVGGVNATAVTVTSDTSLSATVPARSSTGSADIVVTNNICFVTVPNGFSYTAPTPTNPPTSPPAPPAPPAPKPSTTQAPAPTPSATPAVTPTPAPTATVTPTPTATPSASAVPLAAPAEDTPASNDFPWWIVIVVGGLAVLTAAGVLLFRRRG